MALYVGGTVDANKFDDYEEGSWTVTIQVDSYNFNGSYSSQSGKYTKIGNMVTCSCYLQLSNKGNDNGTVSVNGLPFTSMSGSGSRASGVVGYYQGVNSSTGQPMCILIEQNDRKITMRQSESSGSAGLAASDIQNSFGMFFTISYFVA